MKRLFTTTLKDKNPLVSQVEKLEQNRQKRVKRSTVDIMIDNNKPLLNELNAHPRDKQVRINEEEHVYYLSDGSRADVSVTTLISFYTGKFDGKKILSFMFTPARCDNELRYKNDNSPYYNMTRKEILTQWSSTGTFGTTVHNYIETYLLNYPRFKHLTDDATRLCVLTKPDEEVPDKYMSCLRQFFNWEQKFEAEGWTPFQSEKIVFDIDDPDLRIAGSIDAIYSKPNETTGELEYAVVDWKTSSKNFSSGRSYGSNKIGYPFDDIKNAKLNHYSMQLHIYRYLLEKHYGMKIVRLIIVQLNPEPNKDVLAYEMKISLDVEKLLTHYRDARVFLREVNEWQMLGYGSIPNLPENSRPIRYEIENDYVSTLDGKQS